MKGIASPTNKMRMSSSDAPVFLIVKGLLFALLLSLLITIVLTAVIYWAEVTEKIVPYVVVVGSLVSIVTGSFFVGKKTWEKGWLRGGLTGLFYVITLLLLASFAGEVTWHFNCLTKMFLGFTLGALGGIMGINS